MTKGQEIWRKEYLHTKELKDEGREERNEEIAVAMIKENIPIDKVTKIIGLSAEQISKLQH